MTKYFTESALEKQMMQIPKNPRKAIRRFVSSAFRNDVHKSIFEKTVSEYINRGYILSNRFLAAVFILSSDAFLWKQCKYKIKPNHIAFEFFKHFFDFAFFTFKVKINLYPVRHYLTPP